MKNIQERMNYSIKGKVFSDLNKKGDPIIKRW